MIDTRTGQSASEKTDEMASHREIEVKLRTDPAKFAKIRRSPWWRGLERLHRQSLHSVYYDTTDHRLRDNNISLRTRTDGHSFVQTLKLLEAGSDSVNRQEWETVVPDPIPDPSLVIDPALPHEFRKLTSADLQPVFDVEVKRETRRVAGDDAQIDVSLDQGTVIAGKEREAVNEIELELVTGDLPALFEEVRRIADLVDGRLHSRTKADIGYALGDSEHRHWSRAAKLSLSPEMTAGDSLHFIVLNSLSHLTANDDCARLNLHIEGVHQCRVALRRLRSALKIYRPLLRRKRIAPIDEEVRWLGRVLGTARDLDVLQAELLEPAIAALGEEKQLAPLMVTLEARKAEAYRGVAEALGSASLPRIADRALCSWPCRRPVQGRQRRWPEATVASSCFVGADSRPPEALEAGSWLRDLSKPERHEVRIALKRLRYALDFFSDIFDGEQKKKFVKKLTRLQEDLGRMNDVAVAETMLASLVGVTGDEKAGANGPIRSAGVRGRRRARLASPARRRDRRHPDQGLEVVRAGEAVLGLRTEGVRPRRRRGDYPTRRVGRCASRPIHPNAVANGLRLASLGSPAKTCPTGTGGVSLDARLPPLGLMPFSRIDCLTAFSAAGPTFARKTLSCARVSVSSACFNDSHFTAFTSSMRSHTGPPIARMCQN